MSGGGSQTTTSSTTVPPQFLNAYQNTVSRAQNVANNPYQAYTGNLVAGFTPQQTQAQGQVSALQGQYQPELNAAQSSINASTTPLWSETMQSGVAPGAGIAGYTPNFTANNPGVNASTIAQYENPFQSQVIGSTEAEIANTDAQQQAQLSGNAASAGAFGGDRMGVAQGILGGQQALANNSTLAGLNTTNYDTALQTAEQQQATGIAAQEAATQMGYQEFNTEQGAQLGANEANAWLNSQAGYADANLANEGNQLGLTDASALAQSGLTQQQQAQAGLNTAYEQWQAQQAFPYQQTGWLANITEGIGSNVGGSSTTSTSQNNRGGRIHRWGGGIIPASYDNGGGISILGDTPDPANSYIPSASGGGGSMGRGPPSPGGAPPMQQNPLSNPATDIGALNGALSLYNNLGIGSMLSPATTTTLPSTTIGGIATGTPAIGNAAASAGPGFLGNVANTVATGASDAASAIGSGVGAAADAVGNGLAAGAGAIGSGLGWLGDLFLSIFAKDGGRIGAEEPQHHAGGGIVIPFPQDRMHRASGGIAAGNYGQMPYSMAPPVPLQATGTTGMAPMSFAQPGASPMSPSGGGIGSAHGAPMPYGGSTAFRRGGIVPHFDDGGTTPDAPAANDDDWSGAGDTPSAADTANWNAPAIASQSSGIASSGPTYTAEKPNLWMPAVAGIASAVLGRHTNNARNVAEGVLAGLGTYQGEEKSYQTQREKAADLDQQAKQLADNAMFHKEQLALDQKRTDSEVGLQGIQTQEAQSNLDTMKNIRAQLNPMSGAQSTSSGSGASSSGAFGNAVNSIPNATAQSLALKAAVQAGLSPNAAAAWISTVHNESGWNLQAKDGTAGEIGPGQVKPDTGQTLGYTPQQLRDPQTNLLASAQYFKKQWDAGGNDPTKAMAGYNTGDPNKADDAYVQPAVARLQQWGGVTPQSSGLDLSGMIRTANVYLRSGDPKYIAVGKDLMQQVQEISKNGTTIAPDGSIVPIKGSIETSAKRAGAIADAELPAKVTEALANRSAEPVRLGPNEAVTSGFNLLPPALQQRLVQSGAGPNGSGIAQGASGAPGAAPQVNASQGASFQPSAPPAPNIPVVTRAPPDLPPSPSLASPSLVRNPDGSMANTQNSFSRASAEAQGKDVGAIPQHLETLGNTRTQLVAIRDEVLQNAQAPGFLQQGYGAAARNNIAKAANSVAQSLGYGPIYDPTAVGNNESFNKNANVAAFTLARTMSGGRVALGEVMQANQSVPNPQNSFYGNTVVSNLLLQDNMRQTDRMRYQAQQAERGVSPVAAGDAFDRVNPPQNYVVSGLAAAAKDFSPLYVKQLQAQPTPANIQLFDKKFGQGTAQVILGQSQ